MPSAGHSPGRVAALDLGEVRTGVAVSDAGAVLARPLEVVPSGELTGYLRRLVREESISEVLVGVPKTLAGEIGPQARRVQDRIEMLRGEFPAVRFVEWDERLTTRIAAESRRKKRRRGARERLDHLAAARMLQEYLETRG